MREWANTRASGRSWASVFVALAAAAVPFVLYVSTMAPTVYGVDSAELTTAAYLLGIAHPPGAPGYLLLGHLFTWLPIGDVGYRLNLLSAVAAALSILFVYQIIVRLTGERVLALATGWFVASTYYVWITAVAAELYAVQGCFVVGLIALALSWRAGGRPRQFYLLWLVFGFGLGVHLSLVLLAPGFALLTLGTPSQPWRRPLLVFGGLISALLGASVYFYLPIRYVSDLALNPARDYWQVDLASWHGFWWMISGRAFERHYFTLTPSALPAEIGLYAYRLWSNFMGLGALLGLVGLLSDLPRRPWVHGSLIVMLVGHLGFFLFYGAGDREFMFLPTYLIWGLWVGLGVQALFQRITLPTSGVSSGTLGSVVLFTMAALTAAVNFRFADISDDWSARERGEAILRDLDANAVYFGLWEDVRIVEYLQYVEGRRPDVETVDLVFSPATQRDGLVAQMLAAGRPVYVAHCEGLSDTTLRCEYHEQCDCYRIRTVP